MSIYSFVPVDSFSFRLIDCFCRFIEKRAARPPEARTEKLLSSGFIGLSCCKQCYEIYSNNG